MTFILIFFLIILFVLVAAYLYWHKKASPPKVEHYKLFNHEKIEDLSLLKEQGHCNINYLLQTDKQNYLLRTFKHKSDRKAEFYIQNLAHKKWTV